MIGVTKLGRNEFGRGDDRVCSGCCEAVVGGMVVRTLRGVVDFGRKEEEWEAFL